MLLHHDLVASQFVLFRDVIIIVVLDERKSFGREVSAPAVVRSSERAQD
mgnify:CR=1 FL=1